MGIPVKRLKIAAPAFGEMMKIKKFLEAGVQNSVFAGYTVRGSFSFQIEDGGENK